MRSRTPAHQAVQAVKRIGDLRQALGERRQRPVGQPSTRSSAAKTRRAAFQAPRGRSRACRRSRPRLRRRCPPTDGCARMSAGGRCCRSRRLSPEQAGRRVASTCHDSTRCPAWSRGVRRRACAANSTGARSTCRRRVADMDAHRSEQIVPGDLVAEHCIASSMNSVRNSCRPRWKIRSIAAVAQAARAISPAQPVAFAALPP